MTLTPVRGIVALISICFFTQACTRSTIGFGSDPENSYTDIVYMDTISVSLSTVVQDSFVTSNATSLLVGRYKDPYLGIVTASNFFQMTIPSSIPSIPASAFYDSVTFIFRPGGYYYGDTTQPQTFYVHELADAITHTYNSNLYNTSAVAVKAVALGAKTLRLRPAFDTLVEIRLDDALGNALFEKLRVQSTEVTNAENFLNYFRGISLSTAAADTGAVYGLNGTAGSLIMRVYYRTTIPYPEKQSVDFTSLANSYTFNRIVADRAGTGIATGGIGLTEISALQTNNQSFLQAGTGVYLKATFPSLKSILSTDKIVRLIKAELILRPAQLSFDRFKYRLPPSLYLSQTDASNLIGAPVYDSTGAGILYASPVIDDIYGKNNYYRFNITPYVNQLLNTPGSADDGFFVQYDASASAMNVERLVANNALHGDQSSKLVLHMLIINK